MWSKWHVAQQTALAGVLTSLMLLVIEMKTAELIWSESNYQHVKWNISGLLILHGDILMKIVFSNCVTGISLNSVNQLRLWTIKADQPETQEVCQLDWDSLFSAKAIQVDTLRSITDGRCRSSPVWMLSHETVSGHVWLWMLSWRRFIERPASQGQGQRSGGLQSMSHHALGQSGAASVSGLPLLKMW